MFWSILHRMILWELAKVFVLSLIGITGILLMAGIIAEASQQGLGPTEILEIIPFLIPSTLPYTIPATTLFATCVVYGRLAHDNEILALRSAGVNLLQVVWPAMFLGIVMSSTTMALYYRIIPYTHHLMRTMFLKDVEQALYALLNRDKCINYPNLDYAIFVRRVEGRKLYDAVFKHRDKQKQGTYNLVAWAREAELRVDMERREIVVQMRYGEVQDGAQESGNTNVWASFEEWDEHRVPLPTTLTANRPPKPRDMTWQEILSRRVEVNQLLEFLTTHIGNMILQQTATNGLPREVKDNLRYAQDVQHARQVEMNTLDTELEMRPALSFGCLFFVLVGCPIGIWFSKSDYLSAFIICFLPIVFIYYPLMLCGSGMAKDGKLTPLVGCWAANGIVASIAVGLYWKLLKH